MNHVRRMVLKALRDERLRALVLMSFDAHCLPSHKDYDWAYETSKIDFVREVLRRTDKKAAKRLFLKHDSRSLWHDEHQRLAKRIIERWRKMKK